MSGPRPRFKGYSQVAGKGAAAILCARCDLSPGYGWEAEEEYKGLSTHHWKKRAPRDEPFPLPPAGNGWVAKGLCPHCSGTGVDPVPCTEVE